MSGTTRAARSACWICAALSLHGGGIAMAGGDWLRLAQVPVCPSLARIVRCVALAWVGTGLTFTGLAPARGASGPWAGAR